MKQSNMNAIRTRQEAESAMQESPRAVSESPITTSRAKLATSGKEKSVMKVSQKVLVPMKRFNPKSTPVTQFNPISEELLQSFQQFTNPTEQVRDVRNNMNPTEKIKDARINGNPTEQIRDVSKNMNPTERIRDVGKNVSPTSQIRHARINVNPTEQIRGARKNVNPTEQVGDAWENVNPTEQIRAVIKNMNPTEQIRESRINVNPAEQIRDVGKNVNTTSQIKDGREHANPAGHTNHKRENANTGQSFVKMGSFMKTDQKKSFVKIGAFMKLTTHTKGKLGAHAIPSFPENTIRPRHPFTNTKFCAGDSSAEEYRTDCNGDLISAMDEIEDDSLSDSSESVTGSNGNDVSEDEANSRVDNKNEMFNISQQMDRMVKDKVENIMNDQLNNGFLAHSTRAMPKLKVVSTKIDKKNTSDESVDKINCDDKIKEILVEGFINEARYCLSKKNYEGAIQNARKGLQKSSRGVEAVELVQILTQGLMMTGKLKESLKVINALTRFIVNAADNCGTVNEKLRSDTLYLKATILLKLENIDEAIDILETLVDEQPYYTKAKNKLDKLKQIANNN